MNATERSSSLKNLSKWRLIHQESVAEIYYDEDFNIYWVCYGCNVNGRCESYYRYTDAYRAFEKMILNFSTIHSY